MRTAVHHAYQGPAATLRHVLQALQDDFVSQWGMPSRMLSESLDALAEVEAQLAASKAAVEVAQACQEWIGGLGGLGHLRVSPPLDLMDALARFDDVCPCL